MSDSECERMSKEADKATAHYFKEKPTFYDNIVQKNTKHIEKQGYSRKYHALYGDDVRRKCPRIYQYYTHPDTIKTLEKVAAFSTGVAHSHF